MPARGCDLRLGFLNPNATQAMTESVVAAARAAVPGIEVLGWTNQDGPPAIQGPEDGAAAVPGLMRLLPKALAAGTDALVIACFDDTGLADLRAAAPVPVLGIGQAGVVMAHLRGGGFAVVTTLPVSVPVIETNIRAAGLHDSCLGVLPSGLPVLEVEAGGPAVLDRLADCIAEARDRGAQSVVLGCAGMAAHRRVLQARSPLRLIDGVAAAAGLAAALVQEARAGL